MALKGLSWQTFSSAPHRMMFFAGMSQALMAMVWWAYDLAARYNQWLPYVDWSIPARHAHQFLMLYGLFPLFFFGFLMTAGPRWLEMPPPPRSLYVSAFSGMTGGILLFYIGLFTDKAWVLAGILLWVAGMLRATLWWGETIRRCGKTDLDHPRATLFALIAALLGAVSFAAGEISHNPIWNRVAVAAAIWWCVLPVFISVAHRMIPFFTGNVVRPYKYWRPIWLLRVMLAASVGHGLLDMLGQPQWTWLIDLPAAALAAYVSWRWGITRSMKVWILAMLHIGFAWLSISLAVHAAHSLMLSLGFAGLGLVPLHLLMLGFVGTVLLAMATRVTLGHSGHPLQADRPTWVLFWLYHTVIATRTAAELLMPAPGHGYMLAALLWLACLGWWYKRYAVIFLTPRADGAPG